MIAKDVFAADGPLSALPGYAVREGQIIMATAVERCLHETGVLLVEAPTGTGKSFAYGVPAAVCQKAPAGRPRKVVVCTANIALQEQLAYKDFPALQEILPGRFQVALLKGRNNYLCIDRLAESVAAGKFRGATGRRKKLQDWAASTDEGDVSELPFVPTAEEAALVFTTSDDCTGAKCPHARFSCHYNQAKSAASTADIVIANYHLLFAHMHVLSLTGKNLVLPPFSRLICDESHKIADIARKFLGFRVSAASIYRAISALRKMRALELHQKVSRETRQFFDGLALHRTSSVYKIRLRKPNEFPLWAPIVAALDECVRAYENAYNVLGEPETDDEKKWAAVLENSQTRCVRIITRISAAMGLEDRNAAYFLEETVGGNVALKCELVDVSERVKMQLFERVPSAILTSATLTTAAKDFSFIRRELGIERATELVVPSPFTAGKRIAMLTPPDAVKKNVQDYNAAAAKLVVDVVERAQGRTLGLFTSYKGLHAARAALLQAKTPYTLLTQGTRPRDTLLDAFRRDVNSVLLGTLSFWEGVDVPGEALSCVMIDRLPFPHMNNPVLDVLQQQLKEQGRSCFLEHSVPRAVTLFKQGVGRLIRTEKDWGMVVVLDHRIQRHQSTYWEAFRFSLPPHYHTSKWEHLGRWLSAPPEEQLRGRADSPDSE